MSDSRHGEPPRKRSRGVAEFAGRRTSSSHIQVVALGGGQDVGRSCVLITIGGKTIMFDCGVHMGKDNPSDHYPDFQWWVRARRKKSSVRDVGAALTEIVSCVLVTHFHLDHIGALPYLTENIGYDGPIYMSAPTKAVAPQILRDYVKLRGKTAKQRRGAVDVRDIETCMSGVSVIGLGEEKVLSTVDGVKIRIRAYYAGHVLGAVMYHVRCRGQSVLYTGDYNMTPDRHLGAARVERPLRPDVLVSESTYAMTNHPPKLRRERDFLSCVHSHVKNGGRVLIPVFSLGSVQEMSVLLDQHWERTGCEVPIYFSQGLMEKAQLYYRLYESWTNGASRARGMGVSRDLRPEYSDTGGLFRFRHIRPMTDAMMRCGECSPGDTDPKVVFATPGMISGGLSLRIFRKWADDENVRVVLPGYCSAGTFGFELQRRSRQRKKKSKAASPDGGDDESGGFVLATKGLGGSRGDDETIRVRCEVSSVSFASHVDSAGILRMVRQSMPTSLVLVHGETSKMSRLRDKIDEEVPGLSVRYPANKERLLLPSRPSSGETPSLSTPSPASSFAGESGAANLHRRGIGGRRKFAMGAGFRGLIDLLAPPPTTTGDDAAGDAGCAGCEW